MCVKTITSLDEAKEALFEMANIVNTSSRLTRHERDKILAKVYSIDLTENDRDSLLNYIIQQRKLEGANRAFVENKTNKYMLPLRYIFPSVQDRGNVSRYSGALDQLSTIGVPPDSYLEGKKQNGGLMELYWKSRDRITRKQKRQTITLDKPIEFVDGVAMSLVIRPDKRMIFEVLDCKLIKD